MMNGDTLAKITGEKLIYLRKQKNITQEQLAMHLDADRTTIAGWENSNRYPTVDQYCLLAEIFNVTIDYLVGREDLIIDTNVESIECNRLMRTLTKNKYFKTQYSSFILENDKLLNLEFLNEHGKRYLTETYNLLKNSPMHTNKADDD